MEDIESATYANPLATAIARGPPGNDDLAGEPRGPRISNVHGDKEPPVAVADVGISASDRQVTLSRSWEPQTPGEERIHRVGEVDDDKVGRARCGHEEIGEPAADVDREGDPPDLPGLQLSEDLWRAQVAEVDGQKSSRLE